MSFIFFSGKISSLCGIYLLYLLQVFKTCLTQIWTFLHDVEVITITELCLQNCTTFIP